MNNIVVSSLVNMYQLPRAAGCISIKPPEGGAKNFYAKQILFIKCCRFHRLFLMRISKMCTKTRRQEPSQCVVSCCLDLSAAAAWRLHGCRSQNRSWVQLLPLALLFWTPVTAEKPLEPRQTSIIKNKWENLHFRRSACRLHLDQIWCKRRRVAAAWRWERL